MTHGLTTTFNLAALRSALRARGEGHRQSSTKGDPWQQGGTLIVLANGDVPWSHLSRSAGDHAPASVVLSKLDLFR
jgi:hypothetical protein